MDQLSLFDLDLGEKFTKPDGGLPVVRARYLSKERMTWKEMFEGYDELRAITFSSGEAFTSELLDLFGFAEIIYGCEEIVGKEISTVLAVETALVEKITKSKFAKKLCERLDAGTLKIFVSRAMRSHEKVYCLKANDGRTRVITGSANMSKSAFEGLQREAFVCFDDEEAYMDYMANFEAFRSECSDNVNQKVFRRTMEDPDYLRDNPEDIPVLKTVAEQKYVYLEPTAENDDDAIELVTSTKNLESELKPMMPKAKKEGKRAILTTDQLPAVKAKAREARELRTSREKHYPRLHVDYEGERVTFNGSEYGRNPSQDDVRRDMECLKVFFDGLKSFHGFNDASQKDFFRFLNWYFASPFMPYLRFVANKNNYEVTTFPVVGIMYGDSNGGKSSFIQLLTKLMIGRNLNFCGNSDFTHVEVSKLRRGIEGIPLNFDDLDRQQFRNNADKIIKEDEWGIADGFINYPAISITTNKLPSLEAALSKRVIGIRVEIRIGKEEGLNGSKKIKDGLKRAGTALYSEYICRMLPRIKKMAENMREGKTEKYEDVFMLSSQILYEIYSEFAEEVPDYVYKLSFSDYFGDKVVGRGAIQKIVSAWKAEPQSFTWKRRENRLTYTYPENANNFELQYLADELPPHLNVQKHSRSLSMDLDAAEEFFGVQFRKSKLASLLSSGKK